MCVLERRSQRFLTCSIHKHACAHRYLWAANDYLHGLALDGCENTTHNPWPGVVKYSNPPEADRRCTARSVTARHVHHIADLWESGAEGEGPAKGINGTGFEEGEACRVCCCAACQLN